MHRTLIALMVAALASGALLEIATLALDAWHWRAYQEAQALQSATSGMSAVVPENPYGSLPKSAGMYFKLFVACCAGATFWVVFVVSPTLLLSRRVFTGVRSGHVVSAIVVCVLSGTVFALLQRLTPYLSPLVPFAVGGIIGLLSVALLIMLLPPNKSPERTHEG